jgi:hypothetical protein
MNYVDVSLQNNIIALDEQNDDSMFPFVLFCSDSQMNQSRRKKGVTDGGALHNSVAF